MGETIGAVLSPAIGVAISPVPVIALILMLLSATATKNGLSFMAGWIVALLGVGALVLVLDVEVRGDDASTALGIVKLVVGVLLLLLAVRQFRSRPRAGQTPSMPRWMAGVSSMRPTQAFGLGLLLAGVNPKNLALTVAGIASMAAVAQDAAQRATGLVIFVVLASASVILPVLFFLTFRARAATALTAIRDWLSSFSWVVMTVLLTVLSVGMLGDAVAILGS